MKATNEAGLVKKLDRFCLWPPSLFVVSYIFHLYQLNIDQLSFSQIIRSLLILTSSIVVLEIPFYLLFRQNGVLFLLLLSVLATLGSNMYLATAELGLAKFFPVAAVLIILTIESYAVFFKRVKAILSFCAVTLALVIAWQLLQIAHFQLFKASSVASTENEILPLKAENGYWPDIYYIILDSYARNDILQELYGYDNSPFLDYLQKRGFFLATDSFSNYSQTYQSLASSLNCEYIADLLPNANKNDISRYPLIQLIQANRVARSLDALGYRIISLPSVYSGVEITDVRHRIEIKGPLELNEFELVVFFNSILNCPFFKSIESSILPLQQARERLLFPINKIPEIAAMKKPTFTFAHIMCPHPPFVFAGPEGNDRAEKGQEYLRLVDGQDYRDGMQVTLTDYQRKYREQLIYLNGRVRLMIDDIFRRSPQPPVIIIQGDHGPASRFDCQVMKNTYMKERFAIFNAYFLPSAGKELLYPQISPVNTFRVIFNLYFGQHLPLLKDRSFYNVYTKPYHFYPVNDQLP